MFRRLKIRFMILSMTLLVLLLSVTCSVMNIINYRTVALDADEMLTLLSVSGDRIHDIGFEPDVQNNNPFFKLDRMPQKMSPEEPYEIRYFSIGIDSEGEITQPDVTHVVSVDAPKAQQLAKTVLEKNDTRGYINDYRYLVTEDRVYFVDWGRRLDACDAFLLISSLVALGGLLIVFVIFFFVSGKIVRPISESYEKQKRFITDAGHEIKTPLTIISANLDILKMEKGTSEEINEIEAQTKRLAVLTNDLVALSRIEETSHPVAVEFPLSDLIEDASSHFRASAKVKNLSFNTEITPMITMKGDCRSIERLISVLLDNAIKYASENGFVSVVLEKKAKSAVFSVENSVNAPIEHDALVHLFDRFYRADPSRSASVSGHGIGLSVAKAAVLAHKGKISAQMTREGTFKITALLPL